LTKSTTSPTTSLTVAWTNGQNNDNAVVYKVRLDKQSSQTTTGTEIETTSNHEFTGLTPGAGYKVFVWAEVGDSSAKTTSEVVDSGTQSIYTGTSGIIR